MHRGNVENFVENHSNVSDSDTKQERPSRRSQQKHGRRTLPDGNEQYKFTPNLGGKQGFMVDYLILTVGNLEDITLRLNSCRALFRTLHAEAERGSLSAEALYGACDLLDSICRDFEADIDGADEFVGKENADGVH
ncbi:MAG: hypothetical protein NC489_30155 [Ruminococcus flavefaciens]|nr:hypothetical protein [Ruminococcus flavefaciens]